MTFSTDSDLPVLLAHPSAPERRLEFFIRDIKLSSTVGEASNSAVVARRYDLRV
jgi:hypothetical protein